MKTRILATFCIAAALTAPVRAQRETDNPLAAARDLYASARYDEALAVLNGLQPADRGGPIARRSNSTARCVCSRSAAARRPRPPLPPW